jgi:3-hydroxyisobutyrate dehydrogenase-like beta-hydroxyacid dehydrogenase
MTVVGVLHPGEMGAALGAALIGGGHEALWASEGRSGDTARRADAVGMRDTGSLAELLAASEIVVSVCPPHAALDMAEAVAGFAGVYVDANAISPRTAAEVAARVERGGAHYVDGGIIGPPPRRPGTTRLYLSGTDAPQVAAVLERSWFEPLIVEGAAGAASALKMAYAAWTKGAQALILAARSLARESGVEAALVAEWELSQPDAGDRSRDAAFMASRKAWRWMGEMHEIAASMTDAGLPPGFHEAAAELYSRVPRDNDVAEDDETVAQVVTTVLNGRATAASRSGSA